MSATSDLRAIFRAVSRALAVAGLFLLAAQPQMQALPTMIRLGYPNCVSCHISPQGGGILNAYGRGIDQAQSLQGGDYTERNDRVARILKANGRITHDLRLAAGGQLRQSPSDALLGSVRSRFFYRNVTWFTPALRVSANLIGDPNPALRPSLPYDRPIRPTKIHFGTALIHYRPTENSELAAGRDHLPTGINNGDATSYVRAYNRQGFYDYPTQAKFFWWGAHHQIVPFVFRPSGEEGSYSREAGGGILAEYDLLRNGKTVVGLNFIEADGRAVDRRVMGAYTRLGFGSWGILAEHDVTDRDVLSTAAKFRQHATYAQVFWASREWLVPSFTYERLHVADPFPARLTAWKAGVSARLSRSFTLGLNAGMERNALSQNVSPVLSLTLAAKTP